MANMKHRLPLLGLLLSSWCTSPSLSAANWPQWRGPEGNSTSSERGLPLVWHERLNVAWKTELPGWGNSTPAVWGDAIFVTSQQDEKLLLLRLSKKTGQIVWTKELGTGPVPVPAKPTRGEQVFHRLQNLASPSPATDGTTVVAHFGNGLLAACDFDGKELWRRNLQEDHGRYTIWWGHGNSPVIYQDQVISVCMQDSLADLREGAPAAGPAPGQSYLVAHDLKTGKVRWHVRRVTDAKAEECDAYTTPVLKAVKGPLGKDERMEMIVMGGNQVDSYDPLTGKQWWFFAGVRGGRTVSGPTVAGEHLMVTRGFRGPLTTLKLSAANEGKLGPRSVVWTHTSGTPDTCCPVAWADLAFTITDDGVAQCFNGFSGRVFWRARLKGSYKASPLAAEDRVYFLNEAGLCTVVAASTNFRKLVENQVDDQTLASPAVSDGQIFLRGRKFLYGVGRK
jgi:outer membrane protein assembly factor BamB